MEVLQLKVGNFLNTKAFHCVTWLFSNFFNCNSFLQFHDCIKLCLSLLRLKKKKKRLKMIDCKPFTVDQNKRAWLFDLCRWDSHSVKDCHHDSGWAMGNSSLYTYTDGQQNTLFFSLFLIYFVIDILHGSDITSILPAFYVPYSPLHGPGHLFTLLWTKCLCPHKIHMFQHLTPNVMILGDVAFGR